MVSRATESEILELENKLLHPTAEPIALPLYFLRLITGDFSKDQELGRGGYGVVYKGILRCGSIIAVKKFDDRILAGGVGSFENEASFLMGIKHQNLVQLLGFCAESRGAKLMKQPNGNCIVVEQPTRMLCFEYVCNQGLDKHLSNESSGLEWNMRYEIIKGICSGLNFLHEHGIVHLDLKPNNILMDANMMPKIVDFGLSRLLGEQKSYTIAATVNRAGTMGYMAPEYILRGVISKKADIFSLGVIIIEILKGCKDYPYYHQGTKTDFQHFTEEVLSNWRKRFERSSKYTTLELHTRLVKQCINIALECVHPNKEKRPNVSNIIEILNAAEGSFSVQNSEDYLPVDDQQPECYISEGYLPSASTAKKSSDEPSVKQKWDSNKREQESMNKHCSGYYTCEETKTEKGDTYFNVRFHDDQTSKNLEYFVVVDFKATCERDKKINPQEIIEFSSVLVDGSTGQLESTFHTYVRPRQHPKLTDYCRDLNGIRQKDVDAGVELAVALGKHGAWMQKMGTKKCSGFRFVVVTWGDWDCQWMLEPECRFKGIGRPPYYDRWINLRIPLEAALGGSKAISDLADAVRMAGLEWEGRPRGASDDACNIARLLGELMRRGVQLGITSSVAPTPTLQLL